MPMALISSDSYSGTKKAMVNYFEFFGLPAVPMLDEQDLRRRYLANSKRYHPDFHSLEDEAKQAEVLELSTLNNQAFKVLKDFDQRLHHLLELHGVLAEEGQNTVPQDFLMEMMDINEGLMELEMMDGGEEQHKVVSEQISTMETSLREDIQDVLEGFQEKSPGEKELNVLKDFYFKKRYLLRIRENLSRFAAH